MQIANLKNEELDQILRNGTTTKPVSCFSKKTNKYNMKTILTREVFSDYIKNNVSDKILDKLFDLMETCTNIDYFILQYVNETALIYDTTNDYYISWYKLTHIGRDIHSNIPNMKYFEEVMDDLIDSVKNYERFY